MTTSREGFVLPIVLVCGLLLASMVITFQFVSSSDYKVVARFMRDAQATALADLASDELAATVNNIQYGAGATQPQWVKDLFAELDAAKSAGAATIDVRKSVTYPLQQFPITASVAQAAKGLVELSSISGVIGPFTVLKGSGVKELIYKEELFNDAGKDLTAWDLRGPMNLEVEVAGRGGPFEFSQKYLRGQLLEISDTTPPAKDFTVFSYLPPPSEDYALNDLQRGGTVRIDPGASNGQPTGRVLLRGPLLYLPEEAPAPADKVYMGNEKPKITGPPGTSASYPDNEWTASLATVPGPRELQHPDNPTTDPGGELLPGVDAALVGVQTAMNPRRPTNEKSISKLQTKPLTITLVVNTLLGSPCPSTKEVTVPVPVVTIDLPGVSPVLAKGLEGSTATFETIDQDVVAYYPPLAYFHAPLPTNKQKLKLLATPPALLVPRAYHGVTVPLAGAPSLFTGGAGDEGDVIVTEPVPRTGQTDAENTGVMGLYGLATQESKTYLNEPIVEVAKWLVDKGIDKMPNRDRKVKDDLSGLAAIGASMCSGDPTYGDIARANRDAIVAQAMAQLGLSPALKFLVRRFAVEAKMSFDDPPTSLAVGSLKTRLGNHEGVVVPYGSYYHEVNFWNAKPPADVKDAIKEGLRTAERPAGVSTTQLLDQLLPANGQPQVGAVDSSWQPNQPAPAGSKAKVVRDWLGDKYAGEMLRFTAAKGAADPGDALEKLMAGAAPRGFATPRADVRPRQAGAFGPHDAPPAAAGGGAPITVEQMVNDLRPLFPKGVFPSKARDWEESVTRSYSKLSEYLAAESQGNVLQLRGVVLVKETDVAPNITYSGRGVLIVVTTNATSPAALGGTVTPAAGDQRSRLTVVHRVAPGLIGTGPPPALVLGTQFTGTVYSETGVKPKSSSVRIDGTLVTGLLNKQSIDDDDRVDVQYTADSQVNAMVDAWTLESSGEVSSVDPSP
jgi:hypothetical protein